MYHKNLAVILLLVFSSSRITTRETKKIWLFDDNRIERLNGNVKQVKINGGGIAGVAFINYTVINLDKLANVKLIKTAYQGLISKTYYRTLYNGAGQKTAVFADSSEAKEIPEVDRKGKILKVHGAIDLIKPSDLYYYDNNGCIVKLITNRK